MGLARAPARLVLLLARLVRLALRHLARRHLVGVSVYGATSVVDGRHSVWVTHGPREQRRWRACLQRMFAPDAPAASRPTVSQWAVPQASRPAFQACDVQACVYMCMVGEARTHGAVHSWCVRDEHALRACARVQGAEQRAQAWQWRGDMPLGALCNFFSARCRTRSVHTCRFGLFFCSAQEQNGSSKNAKRAYIARSV